ncbi:unnamed protein product [Paramecium sonneborni]|uniref:Uncharacterized protein n=1 Tax=Paramecium sonneborni TaxID=65129 RepID=A0A8S1KU42_9CILI|nr:unnamed protein product [Paramecium sonneborni]
MRKTFKNMRYKSIYDIVIRRSLINILPQLNNIYIKQNVLNLQNCENDETNHQTYEILCTNCGYQSLFKYIQFESILHEFTN